MELFRLLRVVAHLASGVGEVENQAGVDCTRAGGAREAVEGCEPHGCIKGMAIFDNAD